MPIMIGAHAEPSVRGHVMILRINRARTRYGKLLDLLGESIALLLRRGQIDGARTALDQCAEDQRRRSFSSSADN